MKLRFHGDSLRLRVSQAEMARLAETGRVEDIIRKYTDLWKLTGADTTGYLCGNPQMIEHGKGILLRRGFEKLSLKEEVYWIPPKTLRR